MATSYQFTVEHLTHNMVFVSVITTVQAGNSSSTTVGYTPEMPAGKLTDVARVFRDSVHDVKWNRVESAIFSNVIKIEKDPRSGYRVTTYSSGDSFTTDSKVPWGSVVNLVENLIGTVENY